MKKLLTVTAIVFLMVFTAGLASAKPAFTSPFPITFSEGALYFVNGSGVVTTDNGTGNTSPSTPGDATITLNQATTTSPEPRFFYGTFATDLGSTATTPPVYTFTFTASLGDDGKFHITGTDANGNLLKAAAGGIASCRDNFMKPHKWEKTLSIEGAIIIDPGTASAASYTFSGTLYK